MVLWVFGYGSLIWNPGFDFDEKILGFIKGYKRTFNLGMAWKFSQSPASTFFTVSYVFFFLQLALTTEARRRIRPGPARLNPKREPYA
jgi:hypothetical protein